MATVFDRMTVEGAGHALHRLTLGRMAETNEHDYAAAFRATVAEAPEGLLRAYDGRDPLNVAQIRKTLVQLARHLARESGASVADEVDRLLREEYPELAIVFREGRLPYLVEVA